jgi:DNA-binding winged helix-turn-helix (wHTH) protein
VDPRQEKPRRYRFGAFTLSTSRRVLLRDGDELPLIPRYFDLLVLLVERRDEALQRRQILDAVWSDVVVSDGALSQAVRILRRTLGDDPRNPRFVRTISRHGYRFVYSEVIEEADVATLPVTPRAGEAPSATPLSEGEAEDRARTALATLLDPTRSDGAKRDAAEVLHELGTARTLHGLDRRKGHAAARAYLRDTRWDLPFAGEVPLLGQPGLLTTIRVLLGIRIRRALRLAGSRWLAASGGGALAGLFAGILGGLVLRLGPGSTATNSVMVALPLVGFVVGGLGASGVGAGLSAAETLFRSARSSALVILGALGGGAVGFLAHLLGLLTLEGLLGRDLSPVAGGFEGLVLGAAAGLGYAIATPRREGGMATPQGSARARAAAITGVCCALAAMALASTGSRLGAMSLDFMARTFPESQVGLTPLARLLGEAQVGRVTETVISATEGMFFGVGLILGLTRRPH